MATIETMEAFESSNLLTDEKSNIRVVNFMPSDPSQGNVGQILQFDPDSNVFMDIPFSSDAAQAPDAVFYGKVEGNPTQCLAVITGGVRASKLIDSNGDKFLEQEVAVQGAVKKGLLDKSIVVELVD
jgi:hypothetical protein